MKRNDKLVGLSMQIPYAQIVTRFLVGVNQNLPIIIAILNPSKGELLGFLGGLHWLGII